MDFLCTLPPELSIRILTFIPPPRIEVLFGLRSISDGVHSPSKYDEIVHMALLAMFHDHHVAIFAPDCVKNAMVLLNETTLEYLHRQHLLISPRSIDVFFLLPNIEAIAKKLLPYMETLSRCRAISVQIQTTGSILEAQDECIQYFLKQARNVSNLSIDQISHVAQQKPCKFLELVEASTLTLLYHNANSAKAQLQALNTNTLKHLDISFNGLTDGNLQTVRWPELLESLNLSNNNFFHFSGDNFDLDRLSNLKHLDISNNNLMSVTIRTGLGKITHLNISGNNLTNTDWLSAPTFCHLKSIDLAHNMIVTITQLPKNVEYINFRGNFLNTKWTEILGGRFPPGLNLVGALHCPLEPSPLPEELRGLSLLRKIKALYFSGFTYMVNR